MKKILAAFTISVFTLAGFIGFTGITFANSLPLGGQTYFLAGAGVTSSQNTVQLTSFQTADGTPITMTNFGTEGYGTLEPQSTAKVEFIHFTGVTQNGNGTATLTGVTRGIGYVFPYTSTSGLMRSHAGGASFIISNTPEFYYNEFAMPGNANVTVWPFASTSPATKGYVDFVAFNGAAVINANTANKGVVQIATGAQAAATTVTGSTGSQLVLPAAIATSTYNAATAANVIPVTGLNGKLDPNFVSPLASTTVIGSTFAFDIGKHEQVFTSSGNFPIPNGIRTVYARIVGGGGSGAVGSGSNNCSGGGGTGAYGEGMVDVSATTSLTINIGAGGTFAGSQGVGGLGSTTAIASVMSASGGTGGTRAPNLSGSPSSTTGAGGLGGTVVTGATASSTGAQGGSCFITSLSSGSADMSGIGVSSVLGMYGASGGDGINGNNGAVILYW